MSRDNTSVSPSNSYGTTSVSSSFITDAADDHPSSKSLPSHNVNTSPSDKWIARYLHLDLIAMSCHKTTTTQYARPSKILTNQLLYLSNVLKEAFALADAIPLRQKVDSKALNIPNYPVIIKQPVDLGTIKYRLLKQYYYNAHECICDLNQVFTNCYVYNHSNDPIIHMTLSVEKFVREKLKNLPFPEIVIPLPATKRKSQSTVTRKSSSNAKRRSVADGNSASGNSPPHSGGAGGGRVSSSGADLPECLRQCLVVLKDLKSRLYSHISEPFLEPVDTVKLGLNDYHTIIKRPMDIQTMTEKLTSHQYNNHQEFNADFYLMIENCKLYNGQLSPFSMKADKLLSVYNDLYKRYVLSVADKVFPASSQAAPSIHTVTAPDKLGNAVHRQPSSAHTQSSVPVKLPPPMAAPSINTTTATSGHHPKLESAASVPSHLLHALSQNPAKPAPPSTHKSVGGLPSAPVAHFHSTTTTSAVAAAPGNAYPPMATVVPSTLPAQQQQQQPLSLQPAPVSMLPNVPPTVATAAANAVIPSTAHYGSTNSSTTVFSKDEENDLQCIFSDIGNMSQKATELAILMENIKSRIQQLCDKKHTNLAGLQKFLTSRGFDTLPDFFMKPAGSDFVGIFNNRPSALVQEVSAYRNGTALQQPPPILPPVGSLPGKKVKKEAFHHPSLNANNNELNTYANATVLNGSSHHVAKAKPARSKSTTAGAKKEATARKNTPASRTASNTHNTSHMPFQDNGCQSNVMRGLPPTATAPPPPPPALSTHHPTTRLPVPPVAIVPNEFPDMTFDEKRELSLSINNLPQQLLDRVVQIINTNEGTASNASIEEIEIDFDTLKPRTLHALKRFVQEYREESQRQEEALKRPFMNNRPNTDSMRQKMEVINNRLQNLNEFEFRGGGQLASGNSYPFASGPHPATTSSSEDSGTNSSSYGSDSSSSGSSSDSDLEPNAS